MAGTVVAIMGPSGAGKSQQAKLLEASGWTWVSSGELLRHDIELAKATNSGHLVESEEVEQLISTAISELDLSKNIVLDGFPREISEAIWLEQTLAKLGRPFSHVFLISVSPKLAAERLQERDRSDDTVQAQSAKWHDYCRLTVPVVERYRRSGLLVEIDGAQESSVVAQQIDRFVQL